MNTMIETGRPRLIIYALREHADDLVRRSKRRSHAGEHFAELRAKLRSEAESARYEANHIEGQLGGGA